MGLAAQFKGDETGFKVYSQYRRWHICHIGMCVHSQNGPFNLRLHQGCTIFCLNPMPPQRHVRPRTTARLLLVWCNESRDLLFCHLADVSYKLMNICKNLAGVLIGITLNLFIWGELASL